MLALALRVVLAICTLVVIGVTTAQAEMFVCGDTSSFTGWFDREPTAPRPGNCTQVTNGNVAPQKALIAAVARYDYLKVVGGLVVEKTAPEKAAVDSAIADAQAAALAMITELASNDSCSATDLATVNSRLATAKAGLDAQIDGISTNSAAVLKAALHQVVDLQFTIAQKTIRCFTALKRSMGR